MSKLIKFTHSEDGALNSQGSTGLSLVTTLGALAHTSQLIPVKNSAPIRKYATDEKGINDAINKANEAIAHLQWSIQSVSSIIALCDNKEDIAEHLTGAMWAITGLSELSTELSGIALDMQFSTEHQA